MPGGQMTEGKRMSYAMAGRRPDTTKNDDASSTRYMGAGRRALEQCAAGGGQRSRLSAD